MNFIIKRVVVLSILFNYFSGCVLFAKSSYKHELAVCAIFQNDAPYLREWIEFHKLVGATHFYLCNNLSTDDYLEVLTPYIEAGEVDLIEWPFYSETVEVWDPIQRAAYDHVLDLVRNQVKWLAILDTDGFLFPVMQYSLLDFLLEYEKKYIGAVCVNWQMYGTSNVQKLGPGQLMIEELIYKAPTEYCENIHIKSIVRPERIKSAGIHGHELKFGFVQLNANMEPFAGRFRKINVDKVRINHYWTRDENFFYNVKVARRKKWADNECIERLNNYNQEIDKSIFKYIPALKKSLGITQ